MSCTSTIVNNNTTFNFEAFIKALKDGTFTAHPDFIRVLAQLTKSQINRIATLPQFAISGAKNNFKMTDKIITLISETLMPKLATFTETSSRLTTILLLQKWKRQLNLTGSQIEWINHAMTEQGLRVIVPDMSEDGDTFPVDFQIALGPNDFLMSHCHEGFNRSQMMHCVTGAITTVQFGTPNIFYPHGAESGFYPHSVNCEADNWFEYIHGKILNPYTSNDIITQSFISALDCDKETRFGHGFCTTFNMELNPDDTAHVPDFATAKQHRVVMKSLMDESLHNINYLLNHVGPTGDLIMICFMRSGSKMIDNIIRMNPDTDLSRLRIYCIPMGDPLSRSGGKDECLALIKTCCKDKLMRDAFINMLGWNMLLDTTSESWIHINSQDIWTDKYCSLLYDIVDNCKTQDEYGQTALRKIQDYIRNNRHRELFKQFASIFTCADSAEFVQLD